MRTVTTWEDQVEFVRDMPPAAAKTLWILLLSGRSLTGKQLEFACDMSEKIIQRGLQWLDFKGLVQNNGKFNGWSLTAAVRQLPLPFTALLGEGTAALPGSGGSSVALPDGENRQKSGFLPISDGENRQIGGFLPSSSSSNTLSNTDLAGDEGEEEESGQENRQKSGFLPNPVQNRLRHCLVAAGIGKRSQKLDEILELDLDPAFVEGHIAVREAALEDGQDYPISWLITKLLDGDPVPPKPKAVPRCDRCGREINPRIGRCNCDIIKS